MKNLGAAIQTRFLPQRNNALALNRLILVTKVILKNPPVTICLKLPQKMRKECKISYNNSLIAIKECNKTRK
jgi:hypothetical protein